MAFIGDYFDHFLEIIDPSIMYQTVQWFEQVFNGEYAEDIVLTEWFLEFFSLGSQLGTIILTFILIVYLSKFIFKNKINREEEDLNNDSKFFGKRLISYYTLLIMGVGIIFFSFLLGLSRGTKELTTANTILFINIGAALGGFLLYPFLIMSSEGTLSFKTYFFEIKNMISIHSKRSAVFGIVSALLSILSIFLLWDLPYQNILLISGKIGILISLLIVSLPLYLIREFYFRTIQKRFKKSKLYIEYIRTVLVGIIMDNLIVSLIFSFGWINVLYMPTDLLYLSIWIRFSFVQNIFATWIYIYSKRNILGSTIFSSILYTFLSVIIFPSYGFL